MYSCTTATEKETIQGERETYSGKIARKKRKRFSPAVNSLKQLPAAIYIFFFARPPSSSSDSASDLLNSFQSRSRLMLVPGRGVSASAAAHVFLFFSSPVSLPFHLLFCAWFTGAWALGDGDRD